MNPALLTAIVSVIMALGAAAGAWTAWVRSNRMAESTAITVTVQAAEDVVRVVTAQLDRSLQDYQRLSERVDKLEASLAHERGQNTSLQLQLGKVRKRVGVLEKFIEDKGWEPPPVEGGA